MDSRQSTKLWYPFDEGKTVGKGGWEGGIIIVDEEYDGGTRITLERNGRAPYAITCGIYGSMVHTRYFSSEEEARTAYDEMKVELARIYDAITYSNDPATKGKVVEIGTALHEFIHRFP
jgi:hypothetical protein